LGGLPHALLHPQLNLKFLMYLPLHELGICFPTAYQTSQARESDQVVFPVVPARMYGYNQVKFDGFFDSFFIPDHQEIKHLQEYFSKQNGHKIY